MLCRRFVFICFLTLQDTSEALHSTTSNSINDFRLLCPPEKLLHLHHFIALAISNKYLQSAVRTKIFTKLLQ